MNGETLVEFLAEFELNFRPFSTKLDHFRRNYNSIKWFF